MCPMLSRQGWAWWRTATPNIHRYESNASAPYSGVGCPSCPFLPALCPLKSNATFWFKKSYQHLNFTTLWATSADDKLIFFLFFPENRIWHFMQIVSTGDNLHGMSNPVFWGKIKKIFQYIICWKVPHPAPLCPQILAGALNAIQTHTH